MSNWSSKAVLVRPQTRRKRKEIMLAVETCNHYKHLGGISTYHLDDVVWCRLWGCLVMQSSKVAHKFGGFGDFSVCGKLGSAPFLIEVWLERRFRFFASPKSESDNHVMWLVWLDMVGHGYFVPFLQDCQVFARRMRQ